MTSEKVFKEKLTLMEKKLENYSVFISGKEWVDIDFIQDCLEICGYDMDEAYGIFTQIMDGKSDRICVIPNELLESKIGKILYDK